MSGRAELRHHFALPSLFSLLLTFLGLLVSPLASLSLRISSLHASSSFLASMRRFFFLVSRWLPVPASVISLTRASVIASRSFWDTNQSFLGRDLISSSCSMMFEALSASICTCRSRRATYSADRISFTWSSSDAIFLL